jgi:hypothetical protein
MLDTPERARPDQTKPERATDPALLARFAAIVGDKYAISDPQMQAPYVVEMRDLFHGRTPLVLRPASVGELTAIVKLANETGTAIVPQGGNTGLVGGQTPLNNEIVLSLNRLDRIREVDATSNTITCEAGVTLQRPPPSTGSIRNSCPRKAPAPSAAIFRPTRAAPRRSLTVSRARMCSASKWCWPTAASCTTSTS